MLSSPNLVVKAQRILGELQSSGYIGILESLPAKDCGSNRIDKLNSKGEDKQAKSEVSFHLSFTQASMEGAAHV